jgi:carboxymethylenebutenolidase
MRIALPSGTPAELATPDRTPTRGVALHPDIMGLRPLFDDLCARLAAEHGWAVCAIEPYPGREDLPLEERLQAPLDVDRVLADLAAAGEQTGADRVAVMGFCMGGMQTFRAAGTGAFDRAVAFYGMIVPPPHWSVPGKDPLDMLAHPEACPTLAILGGRDKWTPPEHIEQLRRLPNIEIAFYPDADHGFVHDPSRPAHRADDAADAWRRVAAFLA